MVLISVPARAEGSYGAIAYSPESDNSAAAADKATQREAEDEALKSCRDETKSNPDSCQSALWFKDACGALAKDSKGSAWGTGWGDTQKIATNWALNVCRQFGGSDCKLVVSICSPGGASTIPNN
jgi:hypothetical protein